MLTGSQIGQARALLGWSRGELSRRTSLEQGIVDQAEERDGPALLGYRHETTIRRACEQAGVKFVDHPPSARLREDQSEPTA